MISLNKFLRKCLRNGVDFKRIRFVRNVYHSIWDLYFKPGVPVTFQHLHDSSFRVMEGGSGKGWNCEYDGEDCELLSVALTLEGVLITLGKGTGR